MSCVAQESQTGYFVLRHGNSLMLQHRNLRLDYQADAVESPAIAVSFQDFVPEDAESVSRDQFDRLKETILSGFRDLLDSDGAHCLPEIDERSTAVTKRLSVGKLFRGAKDSEPYLLIDEDDLPGSSRKLIENFGKGDDNWCEANAKCLIEIGSPAVPYLFDSLASPVGPIAFWSAQTLCQMTNPSDEELVTEVDKRLTEEELDRSEQDLAQKAWLQHIRGYLHIKQKRLDTAAISMAEAVKTIDKAIEIADDDEMLKLEADHHHHLADFLAIFTNHYEQQAGIAALIQYLKHEDDNLRELSCSALSYLGQPTIAPLLDAMTTTNHLVNTGAIRAFGGMTSVPMKDRLAEIDARLEKKSDPLSWREKIQVARLYDVRATVLAVEGEVDSAIADYLISVRHDPSTDTGCWGSLAHAYESLGNDSCLHGLMEYCDGVRLGEQGDFVAALQKYKLAMRLWPSFPWSPNNIAWLLAICPDDSLRNGHNAVQFAKKTLELFDGDCWSFWDTLAAAYAEACQSSLAVYAAEKALHLAPKEAIAAILANLRAYRQGLSLCAAQANPEVVRYAGHGR